MTRDYIDFKIAVLPSDISLHFDATALGFTATSVDQLTDIIEAMATLACSRPR